MKSNHRLHTAWLAPWFIIRRFLAVRGIDRSASLAYVTLLSLVPMLATVAVLYRAFFALHTGRLIELIALVLPYPDEEIQMHLAEFVGQATRIGGIGSVVFLAIAFRLYLSIETALNEVWCVTTKRSPAIRMFSFTMVVFWGPVVMGVGSTLLVWAGTQPWAPSSAFLIDAGRWAVPLLGLTMVYWLAPHTGVHIGAAFVGGLTATLGLHALRFGFVAYVRRFPDINVIYGTLALAIIFLVSLFAFWTLVISGAVTSYVAQNLSALLHEHEGGQHDTDPVLTALAMLGECYRVRRSTEVPPTIEDLESTLDITHSAACKAAERLVDTGMLAVTGLGRDCYVPGLDADSLSVATAMERLREHTPKMPGTGPLFDRLGKRLTEAAGARQQVLERVSFAELLQGEAGEPEGEGEEEAEPAEP